MLHVWRNKQVKGISAKGFEVAVLLFFGRFDCLETTIKQQVVYDFRAAGEEKGTLNKAALASNGPAITGERDAPVVRAMPVMPAAAERSSGLTTAIVYDWRVGTFICEILKRISSTAIDSGRFGMSGSYPRS